MTRLRYAALLGGILVSFAVAAAPRSAEVSPEISADIRLVRIGDDAWRADYAFSRPVTSLKMEQVGEFRRSAWTVLTPGATLGADGGADVVSMEGRPFRQLSVEIRSYDAVLPKQYIAVDRYTDGGRLFYLGFLGGEVATQGGSGRLATRVSLAGRAGETLLAPPARENAPAPYAYFGPRQPAPAGAASAIFDPAIPAWVREAMLDATAKVSDYYARTYGRVPRPSLVIMATLAETSTPGFSMKGGAVGSQIAYRLSGDAFLADHPRKRAFIAQLVAHEMAHVWQQQVTRGGIGEEAPWVHEGGAEAMALDALLKTQTWSAADGEAFVARSAKRCAAEGGGVASYDGIYACGFGRFQATGVDTAQLWRAMMQLSEDSAAPYSPAMVEQAAAGLRARTP